MNVYANIQQRIEIHELGEELVKRNIISAEQEKLITEAHPKNYYHPNIFIRSGLFLFTAFACCAGEGLLFLITGGFDSNRHIYPIVMCTLCAVAAIFVLEQMISNSKHYCSGVDDALLYFAFGNLFFGTLSAFTESINVVYFFCFLILSLAAIRYNDMLATAGAFYVLILFLQRLFSQLAIAFIPVAMGISALAYYFAHKYKQEEKFSSRKKSFAALEIASMLAFYAAGNYSVVCQMYSQMIGFKYGIEITYPPAWPFHIFTGIVPFAFIYSALKRKDRIMLYVGLLILTLSAITFKYYFSFGHPEIPFTLAGIILILISWYSIKYLKTPKHGFTYEPDDFQKQFSDLEALAIAQTLKPFTPGNTNISDQNLEMGGGDFNGGGAGSKY